MIAALVFALSLSGALALWPHAPPGRQWPKSIPGDKAPAHWPTVTVNLGNNNGLPDLRVCLGDKLFICNRALQRVFVLQSDLPNFNSGFLYPVDATQGRHVPNARTSYTYRVLGDIVGLWTYRDVKSNDTATIEVLPSTAHNSSYYASFRHSAAQGAHIAVRKN